MDITDALAPTSDQLDAIELVAPRTFTIDTGSRLGKREGKTVAEIRLVDFPRVWRPSKGMLDVLAACWGTDGKQYVGRRVTLYNDPDVMFGRDRVGGVRIKALSHIDGPRQVQIRAPGQGGRKQQWPVEPITDAAPSKPPEAAPTGRIPELLAAFDAAHVPNPDRAAFIAKTIGHTATPATMTDTDITAVIDALTTTPEPVQEPGW